MSVTYSPIVDPFEELPEVPDLAGQVKFLSHRPVFSGAFSIVYEGVLRDTGQLVCPFESLAYMPLTFWQTGCHQSHPSA